MKVYRFEKNDTEGKRLKTILNGKVFLSRPESFNDLEDCRIHDIHTPDFDPIFYARLNSCLETLFPSSEKCYYPLPEAILDILKNHFSLCNPSSRGAVTELQKKAVSDKIRKYLRTTTGICCFFQGEPRHPLMWAHYASNNTGFCIEYEINIDELYAPIYEVNYSNTKITPSINELLFCPEEALLSILTTKNIEWRYENEVRLIHLNELENYPKGKEIDLPIAMKPIRLIKGANFNDSINSELLEQLSIPKMSYRKFIRSI